MISELTAAIQSARMLYDLVKAAGDLRDFNKLLTAVTEVNAKLMEAQTAALVALDKQLSLANRVSDLEKENRELKDWKGEAERYHLSEVSPGTYAFILKPGMEGGDPPHMICANCFSKCQKSIFQFTDETQIVRFYICHNCNFKIRIFRKITPFSFLR